VEMAEGPEPGVMEYILDESSLWALFASFGVPPDSLEPDRAHLS
jgi:hypothetical protein